MKTLLDTGKVLWVHERGNRENPTVVLIQGLSMQIVDWPEHFLNALEKEFHLVLFDNRDIGLSEQLNGAIRFEQVKSFEQLKKIYRNPFYTLNDMAEDVLSLFRKLEITTAHVVGYSMGGMISQYVAAKLPQQVLSLTGLMTSGGQAGLACSKDVELAILQQTWDWGDIESVVKQSCLVENLYTGSGYSWCQNEFEESSRVSLKRSYRPHGVCRQLLAILYCDDRREMLESLTIPTLFIHGDEDQCIPFEHAVEGASLMHGGEFLKIRGMGHSFPASLQSYFAELITKHINNSIS
ncbi:alpha/beta fold hydrolase [Kiloniella sp.]|uniref:alpha/beta fold hydrolase n=1 Tax=Kiloniella sp. TaxID=1938587 RepID=UPI003A91821D